MVWRGGASGANVLQIGTCVALLIHKGAGLHSAATDRNLSDLVNDMVRRALQEDLDDLAVARKRRKELRKSLESVVKGMRRSGRTWAR